MGGGLTKKLLVRWKLEFPPELPAPGFREALLKGQSGNKVCGGERGRATGRTGTKDNNS